MSTEITVSRGNIYYVNNIKIEKKILDGGSVYIELTVFEETRQKVEVKHEFTFFTGEENKSPLELIGNFELSMTNEDK
tara:strand:- start:3193 stop:3426 length:234 start_codon:yes stop_codon:yes gene_type:complete